MNKKTKFLKFISQKFTNDNSPILMIEIALVLYDFKPSLLFSRKNLTKSQLDEFNDHCEENGIKMFRKEKDERGFISIIITNLDEDYVVSVLDSGDKKKLGEILGYVEPDDCGVIGKKPYAIGLYVEVNTPDDGVYWTDDLYLQKVNDVSKGTKQMEVVEYALHNDIKLPKGYKIETSYIIIKTKNY